MSLGEAMLRAGSLINELSKRSAAGAETILNYTSRLGGVGSMAKFSMDQLAGLGASLDAVGVPAERGSTALAKMITGMGTHAKEFALALGMTTEEYRNAMETDINATMLKLAAASAAGNRSIMDVVEGMDKMDVSGVRVMEVYGKLVQNMDLVIEQQAIAKAAFGSSASVMNEFYIMSKDFDSLMAIQGKRWKALSDEYSKAVAPSLYKMHKAFTDIAYAMKDVVVWIGKHINGFISLGAAMALLKSKAIGEMFRSIAVWIRVNSKELWINTTAYLRNIKASVLHSAAVGRMQIAYWEAGMGVKGLIAALRSLYATMIKNPYTAVIALISLAASAFFLFKKRTDELTEAQKYLTTEIDKESGILDGLFERLKQTTEGTKERANAINDINVLYGSYLESMLTESMTLDQITEAQKRATIALRANIAEKTKQGKIADIQEGYNKVIDEGIDKLLEHSSELKKVNKQEALLKAGLQGQARAQLKFAIETRETTVEGNLKFIESINKFKEEWGLLGKTTIEKSNIDDLITGITTSFNEQKKAIGVVINEIDNYTKTYEDLLNIKKTDVEQFKQAGGKNIINEDEYKIMIDNEETMYAESINNLKENALEQNKTGDFIKKEEMRLELEHTERLLDIETKRWTAKREVIENGIKVEKSMLIGGEKEIRELQSKILNIKLAQRDEKGGGGAAGPSAKDRLDDNKIKEAIEKAETEHNLKLVEIKRNYLEGMYLSQDEYNDKILEQEIIFLGEKLKIYEKGDIEYAKAYNELLEKKVEVEDNINDRILSAQKHFARIKTDRQVSEVDRSLALEDERWAEEKVALESNLVVKSELSEKEIQLNDLYNKIIEAKEKEHQERLRKIKLLPLESKVEAMDKTIEMMRGVESDTKFTNNDQLKIIKEERLKIIKEIYDAELEMAGDNLDAKLSADKKYNDAKIKLDMDMFDIEKNMSIARIEYIQSYIGVLRTSVGEETKLGKSLYLISQGLAVAAVWIKVASDNAKIYSTALAEFAWAGPAAPGLAALWAAPALAANKVNAALATGLILAQTIGEVVQWKKGNYPEDITDAQGKYKVIGKDDGKVYDAGNVGRVETGIYENPSVGLFAEKPEMVVDNDTLENIKEKDPALIGEILQYRDSNPSTVVLPVDIVRNYMYSKGVFMGPGNTEGEGIKNEGVKQFAGGTFPVIGEDDKKTYKADYVGPVRTGLYRKPSLGLFAEKPEMVIDYPTLRNIQMNNPRIIEAILAYRVTGSMPAAQKNGKKTPQFADGNYPEDISRKGEENQMYDPEIKELLRRNIEMQEKLMAWKPKVYTDLIKRDLETLENIERNRGL
jgi:hypothetical protein